MEDASVDLQAFGKSPNQGRRGKGPGLDQRGANASAGGLLAR